MNKFYATGRTTRDVEIRYTSGEDPMAVGKFSLAVDSGYKDNKRTDFFNMTVFGKKAETMENYVKKGTKILVECEAKQEQYTNKDGQKVNTVSFIVRDFEFCESKGQQSGQQSKPQNQQESDGFMSVPDAIDEELPFA